MFVQNSKLITHHIKYRASTSSSSSLENFAANISYHLNLWPWTLVSIMYHTHCEYNGV